MKSIKMSPYVGSSTSALRDSGVTKHMFWDVIISGGSAVGSAAPLAPHLFFFFLQVRDIIAGSLAGSVFGVAAGCTRDYF